MSDPFVSNPCRYPDVVRARVPRGLRQAVKQAADAEHIPLGEFVRRALSERLNSAPNPKLPGGDDPGPFNPASGMRIAA